MTTFDTMSLIRIKLKINHVRKECINGNVKHKELKYFLGKIAEKPV